MDRPRAIWRGRSPGGSHRHRVGASIGAGAERRGISPQKYYEDEELFFRDNEPAFVTAHEYFAKLAWAMAAGRRGCVDIGLGGRKLRNTFYSPGHEGGYREDATMSTSPSGRHTPHTARRPSTISTIRSPEAASTPLSRQCSARPPAGRPEPTGAAPTSIWRGCSSTPTGATISLGRHWVLGTEARALLSNRPLPGSYEASVSSAPAYSPTPGIDQHVQPRFTRQQLPRRHCGTRLQIQQLALARFSASVFAPLRGIREGDGERRASAAASTLPDFSAS